MEILGWIGTSLTIVGYYPQIHHLYVERCAWGISVSTWLMWLAAGVLLLAYASSRSDVLFIVVQLISIVAIAATIFLVRRSNNICHYHLAAAKKLLNRESAVSAKLTFGSRDPS